MKPDPEIIQGGMGVAVSNWHLARTVSMLGQMGVVSGTALDVVLARRLQTGDPGGDLRRAMERFPDQGVAERILGRYFVPGGKAPHEAFKSTPVFSAEPRRSNEELAVMGGFVEVYLAKEGHDGPIGINFLEKVQLPIPGVLYGALLAGVDYVLVGAGIPRDIPRLIDTLIVHDPATLPLHVVGVTDQKVKLRFDPRDVLCEFPPALARPKFLAIIASTTLATSLVRKTPGVDGFVIEGPTAGGHNAPPRGELVLENGQPVYGPRDEVDLAKIAELGLPFWLAGGQASPERLREAQEGGAVGIQVGTAFAFCEDSGMDPTLRARIVDQVLRGGVNVFTDPLASPTGFPFKVAQIPGTLGEAEVFEARDRRCDLSYLRDIYVKPEGGLGYRCPAEPVGDYVRKGGDIADTVGRKCLCNGLFTTIGLGQLRDGQVEPAIVTVGDDISNLARFLPEGKTSYTAADVVDYLLGHRAGAAARPAEAGEPDELPESRPAHTF